MRETGGGLWQGAMKVAGAQGLPVLVSSHCSRALLLLSHAVGWSFPVLVPALQPADSVIERFRLEGTLKLI